MKPIEILRKAMNRGDGQACELYALACEQDKGKLRDYLEDSWPLTSERVWNAAHDIAYPELVEVQT